MWTLEVKTSTREELKDITSQVQSLVRQEQLQEGVLLLYSPHTTCGITINEGADPAVARDIIQSLKKLIPLHWDYAHLEGNSDAHLKTSLIGPSQLIILEQGQIKLGTWQRIFLAEFDGPRNRKVWIKLLK
ncbi:MAG: hypothetical protein PWR24_1358 [Desulfonauticus sp.]|jgi:secondary thiamine-phosphate synthase enzyme|nr:hypothetical protein [Desulfonauticus sp.]